MLAEQSSDVRTALARLKTSRADETRSDQLADRAKLIADATTELVRPTSFLSIAAARGIAIDPDLQARADAAAELAAVAVQALLDDAAGEHILGDALKQALMLVRAARVARDELARDGWSRYAHLGRWEAHKGVMGTLARLDVTGSKFVLIARRLHDLSTELAEAAALSYPSSAAQLGAFDEAASQFEGHFATIGGDDAVPPQILSFIQAASGQGASLDDALAANTWLEQHDLQHRFVVRLAQ